MSQFKPRYAALASWGTAASERTEHKCHVLGLDLMHLLVDNRLSEFHAKLELLEEEEAARAPLVASARDGAGLRRPLCQSILHGAAAGVDCHDEVQQDGRAAEVRAGEYIREKREDWIVEGGTLMFQPPHVGSKVEDIQLMDLIAQ